MTRRRFILRENNSLIVFVTTKKANRDPTKSDDGAKAHAQVPFEDKARDVRAEQSFFALNEKANVMAGGKKSEKHQSVLFDTQRRLIAQTK